MPEARHQRDGGDPDRRGLERDDADAAPYGSARPRTRIAQGESWSFANSGIERAHWSNVSPVRDIFRSASTRTGLPYFSSHTFRHTPGHLAQEMCRTPEELKAWSQNLGHENLATTLNSYGQIDPHRQAEVIGGMGRVVSSNDDTLVQIGALLARHGVGRH